MENVLDITNLVKTYGTRSNLFPALKGINLTVKAGEFMGVMGPSGSGKTTLLNMAATIDRPTSGTIQINGQDIQRKPRRRIWRGFRLQSIGFSFFQDYNLLDTLTLRENIGSALSIAQRSPKEIKRGWEEIAATFDLTPQLDKYLIRSPAVRTSAPRGPRYGHTPGSGLADEPTGAWNTHFRAHICWKRKPGPNEPQFARHNSDGDARCQCPSYCSQIVFLHDGKIVHQLSRGCDQERRAFFERTFSMWFSAMGERRPHDLHKISPRGIFRAV